MEYKAKKRLIFCINLVEWVFEYGDCYRNCGRKGGSCEFCGTGGFCCRNPNGFYGDNGDCPFESLEMLKYESNVPDRHVCVRKYTQGTLETIFKKSFCTDKIYRLN